MFAFAFRFPAGRYHATPWGRNVNEADVAWPPEPWRLMRTLIATYWRKGNHERWSEDSLARLIDALAGTLPVYQLPEGAIHAHTRHYVPRGQIDKARGVEKTTLIFDAFLRLPKHAKLIAAWPDVALDADTFALAGDLAGAIGYLGRAESWVECEACSEWSEAVNCRPAATGFAGDPVRLLAPVSPAAYAAERERLIAAEEGRILTTAKKRPSPKKLEADIAKAFRSRRSRMDTLPVRFMDALALDTADYQDRGWSRPPAGREVLYARDRKVAAGVVARIPARQRRSRSRSDLPTVARFLLAGRPRPRIEDSIKIGELMRRAALSKFGWRYDEAGDRYLPKAPWEISGRGADGRPLDDPSHAHAFWLPEDADSDGLIDHVSVFIAAGINDRVRAKLDLITRLWLSARQRGEDAADDANAKEWRLALEGFGKPGDFAGSAPIFGTSKTWRSVTPFLASGHLKASGHRGEATRLLKRRGYDTEGVEIKKARRGPILGGSERRTLQFHRFRSRGRETQLDAAGTFLKIVFPTPVEGPLALGYGSHFGLGLFTPADES